MNPYFKGLMRKGETVEWESGPQPFALLDADYGRRIVIRWIVTAAAVTALLALYVWQCTAGPANFSVPVAGTVVAVGLYNLLAPILERRRVCRGLRYYITNERLIVTSRDDAFYYMNLAEVDGAQVMTGQDGRRSLAFGSALSPKGRRELRWLASHPSESNDPNHRRGHALGMVFYLPEDAEGALALLAGRLPWRGAEAGARVRRAA